MPVSIVASAHRASATTPCKPHDRLRRSNSMRSHAPGRLQLDADGRAALHGGSFDTSQYDVIGRSFFLGATFF